MWTLLCSISQTILHSDPWNLNLLMANTKNCNLIFFCNCAEMSSLNRMNNHACIWYLVLVLVFICVTRTFVYLLQTVCIFSLYISHTLVSNARHQRFMCLVCLSFWIQFSLLVKPAFTRDFVSLSSFSPLPYISSWSTLHFPSSQQSVLQHINTEQ